MKATTFEEFSVNRRVRYFSEHPEFEPVGTITNVDPISQHVTITWDDEHAPSFLDALEAMRKLEVL